MTASEVFARGPGADYAPRPAMAYAVRATGVGRTARMGISIEVFFIILLILLNGVFAMSEMALVSARRARLAVLERQGLAGAAAARNLVADPHSFLPTVQIGITIVSILAGVFGGARIAADLQGWLAEFALLRPFADSLALGIVVIAISYFTLVLGELVPKQLALRRPEHIASVIARPIALLARIARPAVWLLSFSSGAILRLFGLHQAPTRTMTEEELKALLAEGTQTGVLEHEERDMIERILRLADKPVRAIMTPRTDLAWVDRTDSTAEIIAAVRAASHSRLVVCDGAVDNVVGVVRAKELLDAMLAGQEFSLGATLRQPMIVPDTVSALDALERLKGDPLGMALVMDEYGSFEGVVTAANLLSAIVGEHIDTPSESTSGQASAEGTLTLDGMMAVDELKARLDLPDLPAEGSYHTLAGLLLALLRRVPRTGDRIVFAGWRFEVIGMDGRRVATVRAGRDVAGEG